MNSLKNRIFAPSLMVHRILLPFLLLITLLTGCNEFGRIQKSKDLNEKYTKAVEYFNKADYTKAQMLFDELYSSGLRMSERGESIAYYLAYCNFHVGDYIMASYMFRSYFRTYPTSPRAAECLYMSAYCHYQISPPFSLDQTDTYSAIEEFQYFIEMFPTDTARIHECNKLVDNLHRKLEKKAFGNAKMYYDIGDYLAAITSFDKFLRDYPDTKYREEATYYTVESRYFLALNSVEAKKDERIQKSIDFANLFLSTYKESEFTGRVKDVLDRSLKLQQKQAENKKSNQ
jgi:outer membrane protein assembly factor BamD